MLEKTRNLPELENKIKVPKIESTPFLEFSSHHDLFWTGTPLEIIDKEKLGGLYRGIKCFGYSIEDCLNAAEKRGVRGAKETLACFLKETRLSDFYFQFSFRRDSLKDTHRSNIAEALKQSDAVLLLIGGWGSCAEVWQALPDYLLAQCPRLTIMAIDTPPFNRSKLKANLSEKEKKWVYSTRWANEVIFNAVLTLLGLKSEDFTKKPFGQAGHSRGAKQLAERGQAELIDENTATILLQPAAYQEGIYAILGALIGTAEIPAIGAIIEKAQKGIFAKPIIDQLIPGATDGVKNLHLASFRETGSETIARTILDLYLYSLDTSSFNETMHEANVWAVISKKDRLVSFDEIKSLLLNSVYIDPEKLIETLGDHYSWVIERRVKSVHDMEQAERMQKVGNVIIKALMQTTGLREKEGFMVTSDKMLTQLKAS